MKAILVKVEDSFKHEIDVFCAVNRISKKELIINAVKKYMHK